MFVQPRFDLAAYEGDTSILSNDTVDAILCADSCCDVTCTSDHYYDDDFIEFANVAVSLGMVFA